jgi:photosystem II stability/assembly factor-like uncharacterized protein
LFITNNAGAEWRQVDPVKSLQTGNYTSFSSVAFAPSDPDIVYADAGNYFLRSDDGGESWRIYPEESYLHRNTSENRGTPIALAVNPEDPNMIYMNAYAGGVFLSSDGGRSWVDSSKGMSGAQIWGVRINPDNPAYVVAVTPNNAYVSYDGGESWYGSRSRDSLQNLSSVSIDPFDPNHILIGNIALAEVHETRDAGFSWSQVYEYDKENWAEYPRAVFDIEFSESQSDIVYAAIGIQEMAGEIPDTTIGQGVIMSLDGGTTWKEINSGFEDTPPSVNDIEIHPEDSTTLYIGTMGNGVFKSINAGVSWIPINEGLRPGNIHSLAIDPKRHNTIYAGSRGDGIWVSINGGEEWKQASTGLPFEARITSIAIDSANPDIMYIADLFSGVYLSRNGGAQWMEFNFGLDMRAVNELALSGDGQTLFAATDGMGLYRLNFGDDPIIPVENPRTAFDLNSDESIIIDGEHDDWEAREVFATDRTGDATVSAWDLTSIYTFANDESLYFLAEVNNPEALPANFAIQLSDGSDRFQLAVTSWDSSPDICYWENGIGDCADFGRSTYSYFTFYPAFEGRIDFRDLGNRNDLDIVSIYIAPLECCGDHFDLWRTTKHTPRE